VCPFRHLQARHELGGCLFVEAGRQLRAQKRMPLLTIFKVHFRFFRGRLSRQKKIVRESFSIQTFLGL
jgi:hypothetical protein